MSSNSLVSAITIFLNAEKFIQEAIESVFAQTYDHWELLLVDDGSTDDSTAIAQRYVAQNPARVRYLEHPDHQNRGMSASRNLGIRYAGGDYIAFLDADDVWLPQKLERQVAMLDSHPEAAMLYGNTLYWHSWTGNPEDKQHDHVPELGVRPNATVDPPSLLPLYLKGKAAVPCSCSILVRRDALQHIGGFEDSFRGMYEDQAFYAKMCLAQPVFVSGECLEWYRQHPDSTCSVVEDAGKSNSTRLNFLNWLRTYMAEQGIEDSEVWQALRRELWLHSHPAQPGLTAWTGHFLRWTKKWLLRIEERAIPAPIRRRLWSKS
jgi:glycosyltransferase involved in cell wall biosynthesis